LAPGTFSKVIQISGTGFVEVAPLSNVMLGIGIQIKKLGLWSSFTFPNLNVSHDVMQLQFLQSDGNNDA
jgi:hypothetical protein